MCCKVSSTINTWRQIFCHKKDSVYAPTFPRCSFNFKHLIWHVWVTLHEGYPQSETGISSVNVLCHHPQMFSLEFRFRKCRMFQKTTLFCWNNSLARWPLWTAALSCSKSGLYHTDGSPRSGGTPIVTSPLSQLLPWTTKKPPDHQSFIHCAEGSPHHFSKVVLWGRPCSSDSPSDPPPQCRLFGVDHLTFIIPQFRII